MNEIDEILLLVKEFGSKEHYVFLKRYHERFIKLKAQNFAYLMSLNREVVVNVYYEGVKQQDKA